MNAKDRTVRNATEMLATGRLAAILLAADNVFVTTVMDDFDYTNQLRLRLVGIGPLLKVTVEIEDDDNAD